MSNRLEISEKILAKLRDGFGEGLINAYFDGDPLYINKNCLPCVIIEKLSGSVQVGPTGVDYNDEKISIRVVFDKRDDFGKSDTEALTLKRIRDLVEAKDATTGQYLAESLLGIIRSNFTLDNFVVDQTIELDYGIVPRFEEQITQEGRVTIQIREYVQVPNRT